MVKIPTSSEFAFAGYFPEPGHFNLSETTSPHKLRNGKYLTIVMLPLCSGLMWLASVTTNPLSISEKEEMADRLLQCASEVNGELRIQ